MRTAIRTMVKALQVLILVLVSMLFITSAALATQQRPLELIFSKTDSDGNGLISETEWHTAMQQRFEETDSNHDGNISRDEIEASKKSLRERFQQMRKSGAGPLNN